MEDGWVKVHRKLKENPVVMKDADYLSIWIWLLLTATHQEYGAYHNGKRITLHPGQLVTGRKKIADDLHIKSESKVERVLTCFETEQQIEQQKCSKNRLITILNWEEYQLSEQQDEQQMNNEWTTSEQQVNTIQECKNIRISISIVQEIVDYLNSVCGTKFRASSSVTQRHISARLKDGFTVDDFKTVIDKKSKEWLRTPYEKYLRPETLFGTKFEGYLNQNNISKSSKNNFHNFEERKNDLDSDVMDKFNQIMED